jgi:hypothetical protein
MAAPTYRTVREVEADILQTRCELIAADAEAEAHILEPEAWTDSDALFARLRALGDEYAAIPHPRLPSDADLPKPQAY